jgi:hypothetical protein
MLTCNLQCTTINDEMIALLVVTILRTVQIFRHFESFMHRLLSILDQGRSDGVSRVSNAYGPTAEGGPPKEKIYTRCF